MKGRGMGKTPLAGIVTLVALGALLVAPQALASSGSAAATGRASVPAPKHKFGRGTSTNWSGYAVPGTSATHVIGTWTAQSVSCRSGENSWSSPWVGIDGDNSNTVEQIGTDSDCQNGVPTYYAWFEFFPHLSRIIRTMPVVPGDVIAAEVKYDAGSGKFMVGITNVTRNAAFAVARRFPAHRTSAEWIAEAPASGAGVLPLANFGSVGYGGDFTAVSWTNTATVGGTTGPIASFGAAVHSIIMLSQANAVKAQPSGLSPDGTSFSITWASAGP
jgi:hypothetical protein